ncbi:glutaredoxin domain-containing protein [Micrococcus sp.]|uniref:glutaredoxin domain-containing protein n=1 Tax=Micrococcus sp. TaxID=1271 RepID=UPI002A9141B2|nr:glutaredoxin domain-containing protein [Micrococcus sp.]MDY6054369.1 glutaredoxin domain-containing protein [Micrococcus sp.]
MATQTMNPDARTLTGGRTLTVYTKPRCVQCDATKRDLNRRSVRYDYVDVTLDKDALDRVTSLGYKAVPVVTVTGADGAHLQDWNGYRPDLIAALYPPQVV